MSVIVITGGSRGIGASTARRIAERGMGVILTYNNAQAAAEVVDSIEQFGGKAAALELDIGQAGSFNAFREAVVITLRDVWGISTLTGLVNNADMDCPIHCNRSARRRSTNYSMFTSRGRFS
jgi:NAD(P)-dependent dehydrogenase (short-subunit alcohol dehydrogenase family)